MPSLSPAYTGHLPPGACPCVRSLGDPGGGPSRKKKEEAPGPPPSSSITSPTQTLLHTRMCRCVRPTFTYTLQRHTRCREHVLTHLPVVCYTHRHHHVLRHTPYTQTCGYLHASSLVPVCT